MKVGDEKEQYENREIWKHTKKIKKKDKNTDNRIIPQVTLYGVKQQWQK